MQKQVITYHLEMTDPAQLRPSRVELPEVELKQAEIPCPEFSRFLFTAAGGDWYWMKRLGWTYGDWRAQLERPEVETWVAYVSGTPSGYFELEMQPGSSVEIVNFGLLPQFIGRGIGGFLLSAAIERAWQMGASRVWVHTCTLDHPVALANYKARGFRVFKEETAMRDLPDKPPGPWAGAGER